MIMFSCRVYTFDVYMFTHVLLYVSYLSLLQGNSKQAVKALLDKHRPSPQAKQASDAGIIIYLHIQLM